VKFSPQRISLRWIHGSIEILSDQHFYGCTPFPASGMRIGRIGRSIQLREAHPTMMLHWNCPCFQCSGKGMMVRASLRIRIGHRAIGRFEKVHRKTEILFGNQINAGESSEILGLRIIAREAGGKAEMRGQFQVK
jgi:hypothetical protein